jgi:uncharacterized membrane protein YdbT with pleckstrin-like domain
VDPEPGEELFFHGHPSWLSMLGFHVKGLLVAILVGAAVGLLTAIAAGHVEAVPVAAAVAVAFAAVVLIGLLRRMRTTYTITDRRLTIEIGLLARELHQTRLERVQNVASRQTVSERVLRVGMVDFDTAGEAGFDFSFRGVAHPHQIVRTVDRALHELQRTSGV